MNYWLLKQEPEAYSWADFVKEGGTSWTGVRNFQARNNLRAMKKGDLACFYHSVSDKQIVRPGPGCQGSFSRSDGDRRRLGCRGACPGQTAGRACYLDCDQGRQNPSTNGPAP